MAFIPALRRPRAFWISLCNVVGLACSLAGLVLLFYFSLPNEVPGAPGVLQLEGASPGWEKQQRRYHTYAHWGFTLAVLGTIMEGVPPVCTAIGSARRRRRISASSDNFDLDLDAPAPKRAIDVAVTTSSSTRPASILRSLRPLLNASLIALFILSVVALYWAHETWKKLAYDLATGALVTLFFYWLVVRLPDYQRRQRLKKSLERHYKDFREDCIEIMLLVADDSYSAEVPTMLMEQDKFRDYFSEWVTSDRNRWHEFQNNLTEYYLRKLLTSMDIFREELGFVLNNTDIPKDEPFEFLKRLSAIIYSMKHVALGYDESKPLAQFLWDVFAGWDMIAGYRKEDIIKNMIAAI